MPRALITGITGQDGSYLTESLLARGYEVHGIVRRTSSLERSRLRHLFADPSIQGSRLHLHYAELTDSTSLRRILDKVLPDELYHLAGQSHVGLSYEIPEVTCELTAMATLRILELLRDLSSPVRIYHASSSEVFGRPETCPQDEETPHRPVNPYGCAKSFASRMVGIYRESFGMFAVNGIMYNHESPRRGENFVTRKICRAAAAIRHGKQKDLRMGDLSARRDWGYAPDYVEGMWRSLQQDEPGDYVFATGQAHSVEDVVRIAFESMDLDWKRHVVRDERFMRPAEPSRLVGNPSKAKRVLNWEPSKTFDEMIREMTQEEFQILAR